MRYRIPVPKRCEQGRGGHRALSGFLRYGLPGESSFSEGIRCSDYSHWQSCGHAQSTHPAIIEQNGDNQRYESFSHREVKSLDLVGSASRDDFEPESSVLISLWNLTVVTGSLPVTLS